MFVKIKNIISKVDRFLFKKFGSEKNIKSLENLKEAKIIFSYLNEFGKKKEVKFVGGCVRKALCDENIDDIDLATTLEPGEVKEILSNYNIKVIDTGISHGTVTAIVNQKKFEITTLRKDLSTDGRHAHVEFTKSWEQDASRRDFTINAIYADIEGQIFDPLNGISDLENGKIKFIGSTKERIQEDYLRILRYFRFFVHYSEKKHDQNTLKYIKQNINGLNKISKERVFDEVKKIFSLNNTFILFSEDSPKEIILNIFPQFKYYKRLKKISILSQKLKEEFDYGLVLALLIVDDSDNYEYFCYKYKTSNKLKNRFKNISENFISLKNKEFYSNDNIKKLIYLSDKNSVKDLLLFSACLENKIELSEFEKLIKYTRICQVPEFPISGDYLKEHGYESGEKLGRKLKFLKEKWIENNFVLDKKIVDKSLNKVNRN
tara:strand:- start:492 stop:1790 length:1299 start_codon:yes stop_codon:yes gene_type:complete